uniref:Schlafen AlbA-2 domain-containing protein n=1 Tax=Cyclopterus lumpus TaxID=8103 RepID=A0A8C3A9V8_CYCLU
LQPYPILYQTDIGEAFLKWDGIVQGPMSDSLIEEYQRQVSSSNQVDLLAIVRAHACFIADSILFFQVFFPQLFPKTFAIRSIMDHQTISPTPLRLTKKGDLPWHESSLVSQLDIASCHELKYGTYMGKKTQQLELKEGGGKDKTECYLTRLFYKDFLKYGCAFLNSEGGTLLVGVSGTLIDHKQEDETRRHLDSVAKQFTPPLFPHNYSLRFLPVTDVVEPDLKLICLTFRLPSFFLVPTLYRVNMKVYIKRGGDVQGPLSDSLIEDYQNNREDNRKSETTFCRTKLWTH